MLTLNISKDLEPIRLKALWHGKDEQPHDMAHCLVHLGGNTYNDFRLAIYDNDEQAFVTASIPQYTGHDVSVVNDDTNSVSWVPTYKNKRDHISINDISQWCYLDDLEFSVLWK